MDVQKLIGNLLVAFGAQGLSLAVSGIVTLIVPKILGVETFGYWQLFIFYTSYAGVFHLGLNDGVYLINGGESIRTIDKDSLASQFGVSVIYESCFALLIGLVAFLSDDVRREFVLVAMAFYLLLYNASAYFGFIFQAVNQTRLYSASVIVSKATYFVGLMVLVATRVETFEPYVVIYALSQAVALVYCLLKGRWILSGSWLGLATSFGASLRSIRVGVQLMVANTAAALILGLLRFAVDAKWSIETFGQLSLALSLAGLFLLFVSQIAMVLFPALRQCTPAEMKNWFTRLQKGLTLILPLVYVLFLPLTAVIRLWLPAYQEALSYLVLLLPICVFDGKMNLLCTTFLKVLRRETVLLVINVVSVAVAGGVMLSCLRMDASVRVLIGCAVVIVALRWVFAEWFLSAYLGVSFVPEMLVTLLMSLSFVVLFHVVDERVAFAVLVVGYLFMVLLYRSTIVRGIEGLSARRTGLRRGSGDE